MDELELSGRRHISTKRAGREHGYHSDYIGQLIRTNKVAGQKVGRSWYVDEASLREYLGKESGLRETLAQEPPLQTNEHDLDPSAGAPADSAPPVVEKVAEVDTTESALPEPIAVAAIEKVKPVSAEPAPAVEQEQEPERKIAIHTSAPAPAEGGLKFLPDDEPLLPQVRTRARDEQTVIVRAHAPTRREDDEPRARYGLAVLAAVLALVAAGASAGVGALVAARTVVADGQIAASFYSLW